MSPIRLQKYFTDCGVLSRRAAEEQIRLGKVRVNGEIATVGTCVEAGVDKVEWNGKIIIPTCDESICVLLNKPRGYITTMSDEKGRKNVSMLVSDLPVRVYPIGRLDMDSDGLLLLTNDGELANVLTHPRHEIPKIYRVKVKGAVTPEQLKVLSGPMTIGGYRILPVKTSVVSRDINATLLEMTLYEGRNRQIRKMCERAELKVTALTRIAIGNIKLGSVPTGKYRRLSAKEIQYLKDPTQKKGKNNA